MDAETAAVHAEPVWNEHWNSWEIGTRGDDLVLVMPFIFTSAIVTVPGGNPSFYFERWCYHDKPTATAAAQAWLRDGGTEPTGWHRHPATGRRRPDGDPTKEYVNP